MSRIESGFIPLPRVEQEQPEGNTLIQLNLPEYVDQDRIGVNLTEIEKLKNWGGIKLLAIMGKTDLETSSESFEVHGVNSDGSASASKKVTKVVAPSYNTKSEDIFLGTNSIENRWRFVITEINVDEVNQRVKENSENVRSPEGWSRELDSAIKSGVRKEGHNNLLHDLEYNDKLDYLFYGGIFGFETLLNNIQDRQSYLGLGIYYIFNRSATLIKSRTSEYTRFSLFPGYQLDRAAILSVTSRLKTVVKDLHQEKE